MSGYDDAWIQAALFEEEYKWLYGLDADKGAKAVDDAWDVLTAEEQARQEPRESRPGKGLQFSFDGLEEIEHDEDSIE